MELSKSLSSKISQLKDKNGNIIELENPEVAVSELISIFVQYSNGQEELLYNEIKAIEQKVEEAQQEIAAPIKKEDTVLASASSELDAVIESTEEATNKILDSAESIQEAISNEASPEVTKIISDNIMVIFEACNFQDLTGQRIKKVAMALDFIHERVGHILQTYSFEDINDDKRSDAEMMTGPQSNSNTPDQSDVDKLFDSI